MKITRAKCTRRFSLYLVSWVISLAACHPAKPLSPPPIISPSSYPPTSPSPLPSKSPSPPTLTIPSPQVPTSLPAITLSNASQLKEIARNTFPSWALVQAICWSPDSDILASAVGEDIYFFRENTLKEISMIQVGVWSPSLTFSPDGRLLATGNRDGKLRVWDSVTKKLLPGYPLEAHRKGTNQIAFNPDGSLVVSGGNDGMARLWEVRSGKRVSQMIGGAYAIPAVAFTQDGKGVAIVNAGIIRFREVESGRFIRTLRSDRSIFAISLSPDGKILASSHNDNTISIWDIEKESILTTLSGHSGAVDTPSALVWNVVFSPDGSLLASAGGDATIRIWNVATGDELTILQGHTKAVTSVAFNPDGQSLASGGLDGVIILWGIPRE